ncbi:cytochrome P450 [Sphaerisporangium sp. TRM90804]|uniref:cytochrome P450 n=1 Tax=Sphaerisporangium sp. TRM90804 TaxID=3031113 RepID=UPI0024481589|nr:cytochrome P450 [Sphaerisporangium sp. TRM90804]MDH2429202.1 cytochrome P450 [Sphaerisporangium sp. TRM90804]
MSSDLSYSPFDPEQTKDPYPIWDQLRGECPVYRSSFGSDEWMVDDADDAGAVYVVTRHEDITYILEHPDRFTSGEDKNGPGIPPEVLAELSKGLPLSTTLYNTDPPEHTRLRTLVGSGLSPQRVAANAPLTRATAEELASRLTGGTAELLDEYVRPLANLALLDYLGIPRDDQARVLEWNEMWERLFIPGLPPEDQIRAASKIVEYQQYYVKAVEERRADPREDMLTRLALAETDGGERLSMAEIAWCTMELISAGAANTVDGLANVLLVLLSDQERWNAVRDDRELLPGAIEEGLRLEGPTQWLPRTAADDIELSGVRIPKGATVAVTLQAANRDPEAFPGPERYDPKRHGLSRHVAFGRGAHYCVGAGWSRMALRVGIEVLLDRFPGLRLDEGYEPEFYLPIPVLRCVTSLPVNWTDAG